MSVEALPLGLAEGEFAGGAGRGEPNAFPTLPEPRGRVKCSWNCCKMLYIILGPRRCLTCALMCGCSIGLALCFALVPFYSMLLSVIGMLPQVLIDAIKYGVVAAVAWVLVLCACPNPLATCCPDRVETIVVRGSATEVLQRSAVQGAAREKAMAEEPEHAEGEDAPLVRRNTGLIYGEP